MITSGNTVKDFFCLLQEKYYADAFLNTFMEALQTEEGDNWDEYCAQKLSSEFVISIRDKMVKHLSDFLARQNIERYRKLSIFNGHYIFTLMVWTAGKCGVEIDLPALDMPVVEGDKLQAMELFYISSGDGGVMLTEQGQSVCEQIDLLD